jgi:hypothetical protein
VDEGSVGAARDANKILNANIIGIPVYGTGKKKYDNVKKAEKIRIKAPIDSKNASLKYFCPVVFNSESEKLLPISKVINAKQKLVTGSANKLISTGIKSFSSGFSINPAIRYPIIFGKPNLLTNNDKKYPAKSSIPKYKIYIFLFFHIVFYGKVSAKFHYIIGPDENCCE